MLLCRCLARTNCLFPLSTLSVVARASSYNRSVKSSCVVKCAINSFCKADISSNAFSVPLVPRWLVGHSQTEVGHTLFDRACVQSLQALRYSPLRVLVIVLAIRSIRIFPLLRPPSFVTFEHYCSSLIESVDSRYLHFSHVVEGGPGTSCSSRLLALIVLPADSAGCRTFQ